MAVHVRTCRAPGVPSLQAKWRQKGALCAAAGDALRINGSKASLERFIQWRNKHSEIGSLSALSIHQGALQPTG